MKRVIDRLRKSQETGQVDQIENHHSNRPRIWLWMMGIGALALVLAIPLSIAFAVHANQLFELGAYETDSNIPPNFIPIPGSADILGGYLDDNGDIQDQPGPDWADIFKFDATKVSN